MPASRRKGLERPQRKDGAITAWLTFAGQPAEGPHPRVVPMTATGASATVPNGCRRESRRLGRSSVHPRTRPEAFPPGRTTSRSSQPGQVQPGSDLRAPERIAIAARAPGVAASSLASLPSTLSRQASTSRRWIASSGSLTKATKVAPSASAITPCPLIGHRSLTTHSPLSQLVGVKPHRGANWVPDILPADPCKIAPYKSGLVVSLPQ